MRNLIYSLELEEIFRLRRLPCFPQTVFRRRLEACVQGAFAGGVFSSLQPDRRSVHDLAAWRRVQGVLSLLCRGTGKTFHVMQYDPRAPFHEALCEEPSTDRS